MPGSEYPQAIERAIEALSLLPGVGRRSAERYVQYLLRHDAGKSLQIATALDALTSGVKECPVTYALIDAEQDVSDLYSGGTRDKHIIAVVAEPFDIYAIERTNFKGTYHVLGGLLSPIDGITPAELHIPELAARVKNDGVTELIIAVNASVEGEATSHFIAKQFESTDVHITRLARGLPMGLDIEYADMVTLERAFEGRQAV
jgi:recombination protein RecR